MELFPGLLTISDLGVFLPRILCVGWGIPKIRVLQRGHIQDKSFILGRRNVARPSTHELHESKQYTDWSWALLSLATYEPEPSYYIPPSKEDWYIQVLSKYFKKFLQVLIVIDKQISPQLCTWDLSAFNPQCVFTDSVLSFFLLDQGCVSMKWWIERWMELMNHFT